MKCPKCGYLGFEPVDRCRNCGYDFSLSDVESASDFSIRLDAPETDPLGDLALIDAAVPPRPAPAAPSTPRSSELPLFGAAAASSRLDEPLITKPSPPRPPLAVRRSTPERPRLRVDQPRLQSLDLDLEMPAFPTAPLRPAAAASEVSVLNDDGPADAGLGARFIAAVIDLAVLAAIDAVVIYFTMQICGITLDELDILPRVPLLAFLIVQNGGYLVAFTAGGQTLGKMAAGIKVVTAGSRSSLDLGAAALRSLLWVILAVPAGLGFLTTLFSRDHRGLHDRFAHTRVVRTTA